MNTRLIKGSTKKNTLGHFKSRRWADLNRRTVNGSCPRKDRTTCSHLKKGIELRITKAEFFAWCDQWRNQIESMFARGVVPSVDRLNSDEHYELSNMRVVPLTENIDEGRKAHWQNMREIYCTYRGPDLGKALRRERSLRGFTQRQFAEVCGIAGSHLNMYENNRSVPTLVNMLKISRALNFSLDAFFADIVITGGQGHTT